MRATDADIASVPRANVHVPVAEFAAVWRAAERLCDEQARRGGHDWYSAAVAGTCQWLARATFCPRNGPAHPARSPVTERMAMAHEELIQAELVQAEKLDMRRPRPAWLQRRPGWSEGVCATLRWAWRHAGPPPIDVERVATG